MKKTGRKKAVREERGFEYNRTRRDRPRPHSAAPEEQRK
jgi:hypothetical protein